MKFLRLLLKKILKCFWMHQNCMFVFGRVESFSEVCTVTPDSVLPANLVIIISSPDGIRNMTKSNQSFWTRLLNTPWFPFPQKLSSLNTFHCLSESYCTFSLTQKYKLATVASELNCQQSCPLLLLKAIMALLFCKKGTTYEHSQPYSYIYEHLHDS